MTIDLLFDHGDCSLLRIEYLSFHEIPVADYLFAMTELANHEEDRELEAPISNHAWKSMVAKLQKRDAIKATCR